MSAASNCECRLGVLAFGDSITNGGGELQWGVALQSWALWTARGLGLPYTGFAVDGARVGDVVRSQIPGFLAVVGDQARFELGCLYIGTNDILRPGFSLESFEESLEIATAFLTVRCERTVLVTIPLQMGRPRDPGLIERTNRVIERVARRRGAIVVNLRRFGGRTVLMPDRVHPTAFGQIAIAEAALDRLAAEGMEVRVRPWSLIMYTTTPVARLRADLTYAYRSTKENVRLAWWRVRAALQAPATSRH